MANIFRPGSWLKGNPLPNTDSAKGAIPFSINNPVTTDEPTKRVAESAEAVAIPRGAGSIQDQIGVRAYYLWLQAGQPEGNDTKFWFEAEREILEEMQRGARR